MARIIDTESGIVFEGSIDDPEDVRAAAAAASRCQAFARDDDDECYADGDGPTCFNCRARRWVRGGFTCMRGLLRG